MRLYLSSFGIGNRSDELLRLVGTNRTVALVLNALDNRPEARSNWLRKQTLALEELGFAVTELDLRKYFGKSKELQSMLSGMGLIWINGGNTFILRRVMKRSGFDVLVKNLLQQDLIVYGGFSAAAVVLHHDLHGLEITDDPNDVPSGDDPEIIWEGLGLIPFSLIVHYKSAHSESERANDEVRYYEERGIAYKTLTDGQVFVMDGNKHAIIG